MTLQQCKDQVAHNNSFSDWRQVEWCADTDSLIAMTDEYAKLYAQEKIKEALQLAAEKANMVFESNVTDKKSTYKMFLSWTPEGSLEVNKQSILSLADELIEQINKEI